MSEYDKAFANMAADPLDIDEQQHFDELRRRYDTPEKQRNRKTAERKRLKQAAEMAGYKSIVQLANAIIAGEVTVSAAGR